jgi:hypothetical protein
MNAGQKMTEHNRRNVDHNDDTTMPRKGKPKQYLPPSAFNKTFKSSTTKSLLKFRLRQEQQQLKMAQQYKSYKRTMKREGYEIGKINSARYRNSNGSCDDEQNHENASNEIDNKGSTRGKGLIGKSSEMIMEENSRANDENNGKSDNHKTIGKSHIKPSDSAMQEEVIDVTNDKRPNSENGSTLRQKNTHKHVSNKQQAQQNRGDEYTQQQIQKERDRKEKLMLRKERYKLLSARTKKGQPIMKNIAFDILQKLQREQLEKQNGESSRHR